MPRNTGKAQRKSDTPKPGKRGSAVVPAKRRPAIRAGSPTATDRIFVKPQELLLDPQNPRLSKSQQKGSQAGLIEVLARDFQPEEIAESIIAVGFRPFDPIIAYRGNKDALVVLEGNRRLVALKLLLDPNLAPDRYRAKWQELSNRLSPENRRTIASIPVEVCESRDSPEVQAYIGFRHVAGILGWNPLEKAAFIARLVHSGRTYEQIAESMGHRAPTVEKNYIVHQVIEQAKAEGIPGAEEIKFGVLMRALQAPGVRSFLDIHIPAPPERSRSPVPTDQLERLVEFVRWTFGTDDHEKIVGDSRKLTDWGKILTHDKAIAYLRRSPDPKFDRALRLCGAEAESLADTLGQAADRLEDAVPLVSEHVRDQAVKAEVERCNRFWTQIKVHFPDV